MKRCLNIFLTVFLLLTCMFAGSPKVYASEKPNESRAIAIVFDNSGSMYGNNGQAWCRATYAMEVFASMLNDEDTLQIYPMHPIVVGDQEFTMESPFQVTDAAQASAIRDIFTPNAAGTPIESIDCAVEGLQAARADKKYLIVLTDGDAFYKDGHEMSAAETKKQLEQRFQKQSEKTMTMMYLGIGNNVVMPDTEQTDYFVKKQAKNSEDVLSALTELCNQTFGRDTMPQNHISGNTIDFDISLSKLIVFAQGENISNLKVTGDSDISGKQLSATSTKYGTAGAGNYYSVPDTSLQGMMVTYTDLDAGTYSIDYSGKATSVEVYYEPDADLDFVFTDAEGNTVNATALYPGEYLVGFGIKDAKTDELISSDLLGNPHYEGSYFINGEENPITYDGQSGEVPVTLNLDDSFDATLTVTFLSGYTITKDSSDFGWPNGGIKVEEYRVGDLTLQITGGDEFYSLQNLENGTPYTAKVFYDGVLLSAEELENVELKWEPETSNAEIRKELDGDHYNLYLKYKDPAVPQDTVCGACTVSIYAFYTPENCREIQTQSPLSYNINDDFSPLEVKLHAPQDYIVISELADSKPITVKLLNNGSALEYDVFSAVDLKVDCGTLEHTVTECSQDSAYQIQLLPSKTAKEGNYQIHVTAIYTDNIGRTIEAEDSVSITLSKTPLWAVWLIRLAFLILLIILILLILHIRVLPKYAHVNKKNSMMIFDGEEETQSTAFSAKIEKGQMVLYSKYAGTKAGLAMDVKPGKESYLRKPQARRSAEVKSASVRKYGNGLIQEASIGSIKFVLNEDTGKLERMPKNEKPFLLKHGTTVSYSGTILNAGSPRPFSVTTKLNFKKK